jgi:predicted nucleic acid-binding protein
MAEGRAIGRSRSPIDMIIAATAAANQCVVVTANERHFQGAVDFINPLRDVP